MSRPAKITRTALEIYQEEAVRRAQSRTNKQLARISGGMLTPKYVGQIVARLRREYEAKHPCVDVSCETPGNVNTHLSAAVPR